MSNVDPAIEDRIIDLETRVPSLEAPPTIHGVELSTASLPDYEGRIRSLETLLGALVGQLLGQVTINPELLTEVAAMNRRARENEEVQGMEELPIEVASRANLLAFAKELNVPESALPKGPVSNRIINGEDRIITHGSIPEMSRSHHQEDLEPIGLGHPEHPVD